ncbi:MAG: hypothetical protein U0P45_03660 [Acidimicrobiales bacterium]
MKLHPTRTALGAAVAASLLLAACGTSGGEDAETTTTKAKTTTTTKATTTTADTAAAQDRADSVDLTVSDFPDGWTSSPPEADTGDSPLDKCDESFANDSAVLASHKTDTFSVGSFDQLDGSQVSADTRVFETEDDAKAVVAPFNDTEVVACIDEALKSTFTASGGITAEGQLSDDDPGDLGTDDAEGLSTTYKLTADDGTTANATVAVLMMRTGDVATLVSIVSLGDNLSSSDVQPAIESLAKAQAAA